MRLYHQPRSRSTRVLWLAEEAGAPLDVVVIAREEKSTDDYRKMHPLGRSPAYVEDGGPVFESAALCLHLADRHPEAGLIAEPGSHERALQYQWCLLRDDRARGARSSTPRARCGRTRASPTPSIMEAARARFATGAASRRGGAGRRRPPRRRRLLGRRHPRRRRAQLRTYVRDRRAAARHRPLRRRPRGAPRSPARVHAHGVGGAALREASRRREGDEQLRPPSSGSRRNEREPGDLDGPVGRRVRAHALLQPRPQGLRGSRRAGPRGSSSSGPARADVRSHHSSKEPARSGVGQLAHAHVGEAGVREAGRPARSAIGERERAGDAGRRHGRADLRADGVEHEPEPRVALARSPHGDRRRGRRAAGRARSRARRAAGSGANIIPSRQSTTSYDAVGLRRCSRGRARGC